MTLDKHLNDGITSAVNAKIEGAVLEAMASNDVISAYVVAALQEPKPDRYGTRTKETYLSDIIKDAVRKQTQAVVAEEIQKQEDVIRESVRQSLEKSIGVITDSLVSGFVENTKGNRPSIEVNFSDRS